MKPSQKREDMTCFQVYQYHSPEDSTINFIQKLVLLSRRAAGTLFMLLFALFTILVCLFATKTTQWTALAQPKIWLLWHMKTITVPSATSPNLLSKDRVLNETSRKLFFFLTSSFPQGSFTPLGHGNPAVTLSKGKKWLSPLPNPRLQLDPWFCPGGVICYHYHNNWYNKNFAPLQPFWLFICSWSRGRWDTKL